MSSAPFYPVFVSLAGRRCLLAGFGSVGRRKLAGLLAAAPESVLVLDTMPPDRRDETSARLLADPKVSLEIRRFDESDLKECFMVFAATSDNNENLRIADACRRMGVLCDCAAPPEAGNFILPATIREENLQIALSTGGASPFLARRWKEELAQWLKPRAKLAGFMARARPVILDLCADPRQKSEFFAKICESPLSRWLESGNTDKCREWLKNEFPRELASALEEIFSNYYGCRREKSREEGSSR